MQTAHWIITGLVALLAVLAYVFKAGQWTQERVSRDEKFSELKERFDQHAKDDTTWKSQHVKDDTTWKSEANANINRLDSRLIRVEADRRIVIFPRKNQAGYDDPEG